MNNMAVVMEREKVDIGLFGENSSLATIMRNLQMCTPFVFMLDGDVVAQCLVREDADCPGLFDIVEYAAHKEDYLLNALHHILTYYRENGGFYVDIGCGNADVDHYALFQRAGFRVIGVIPDYLFEDAPSAMVHNGMVNRDMVRFRINLFERTLSTIGYDASGRT